MPLLSMCINDSSQIVIPIFAHTSALLDRIANLSPFSVSSFAFFSVYYSLLRRRLCPGHGAGGGQSRAEPTTREELQ